MTLSDNVKLRVLNLPEILDLPREVFVTLANEIQDLADVLDLPETEAAEDLADYAFIGILFERVILPEREKNS